MKKRIRNTVILLFVATVLLCSCQKEAAVLVDEIDEEEVITANSQLARMLLSASQVNGSVDDIVDGSPCTSVVLPVTVHANNQQVVVETLDDFLIIKAIWDLYPNDTDTLVINFPITLRFEDYYEEEIDDQEDLLEAVEDCQNLVEDTYICVDFNYPISCFTYDSANEQTGRVTLENNQEWFAYLNYLTTDISIAIDYPMELVIDGETIQLKNNQELAEAFSAVDCEIDTGTPLDPVIEVLRDRLIAGTWYIAEYLVDGYDETAVFSGWNFSFIESVTVYATKGSQTAEGIWVVTIDDDELNFEFDMDSPIGDANDDRYEVLSQTDDVIIFVTLDSNNNIEDTLKFVKN
jgi:hypothetical protein